MSRFICDCGQIYSERAAVRECQAARHSAAAGCELADAEAALRRAGLSDEPEYDPRESWDPGQRCECPGHDWIYTGTAYGGDDESYHGEGRVYCRHCGADGDA